MVTIPHRSFVRKRGFTYVALLLIVAIILLAATATIEVGMVMKRRMAEDELLFAGIQYRQAIKSYFDATPSGSGGAGPTQLQDLLHDPRYPSLRRHIRKLYADPLTGKMDWCLIKSPDGKGILGVYTPSREVPIRMANFPDDVFYFKGSTSYAQWVFVYGVVCTNGGCELAQTLLDPNCGSPVETAHP
jgi:type II secretory pathway pseudopilin PulG